MSEKRIESEGEQGEEEGEHIAYHKTMSILHLGLHSTSAKNGRGTYREMTKTRSRA